MTRRIVYLEGRPHAHTLHRRLAQSLNCVIDFIDAKRRWQDQRTSAWKAFLSWVVNAVYLGGKYKEADIMLIDNLHFTPVIMNWIFPFRQKRLVVHLGSHTMYFLYTRRFAWINVWLHLKMLRQYDAIICEGNMTKRMVSELLREKSPPCYVTFLGPPEERLPALKRVSPDLASDTIIILANGPTFFRMYYKGIDLMVGAFAKASKSNASLSMIIVGKWDEECRREVLSRLDDNARSRIQFAGETGSIETYLAKASLCLHCSRGDAFPTSTLEALAAGIPTLVSEWTGTREIAGAVAPEMVVPLDEDHIAKGITQYFSMDLGQRMILSEKSRDVVRNYTQELALAHYQKTFAQICTDLKLP